MKKTIITTLVFVILPVCAFSQMMNIHTADGSLHQYDISEIDSITFSSQAGTLQWLGHASFKIITNDNIVVYIDPYAGKDYTEPADIILVSHGHSDHNQVNKVKQKDICMIFSGPGANVGGTKMAAGDSAEALGIKIRAVQAYGNNHPKGTGVGFVIYLNGVTLYHSGDTGLVDEMSELANYGLDYAMLCIDGIFNMGPEEAMQVTEIIKAKKAIPMHAAPSSASAAQRQENIDKFLAPARLIMQEGETIYL
ncbi:MBL fold metallo-hydrolase [candidate division KSB1 bacterium]|nr:MBL fold metallo-hydrolase [candidate division KSB1 bacterium]